MAFDEALADRVRDVLAARPELSERRMFGGIAFMLAGNMCCGVIGEDLMVRLGDDGEAALAEPHTRPMDFTGKPMRSMVLIDPLGVETDDQLAAWIERARSFVGTLPPK